MGRKVVSAGASCNREVPSLKYGPRPDGRVPRASVSEINLGAVFCRSIGLLRPAYGEVVHFMDIVRGAGATTLGIVTKD
jgi:hypothetical protein